MAVLPSSRYANSLVTVVDDPDRGQHQALIPEAPQDRTFAFTFYQVAEGDTPDRLAYQFYGNGRLWWMLAEANPEILDWNLLTPGSILRIPHV